MYLSSSLMTAVNPMWLRPQSSGLVPLCSASHCSIFLLIWTNNKKKNDWLKFINNIINLPQASWNNQTRTEESFIDYLERSCSSDTYWWILMFRIKSLQEVWDERSVWKRARDGHVIICDDDLTLTSHLLWVCRRGQRSWTWAQELYMCLHWDHRSTETEKENSST